MRTELLADIKDLIADVRVALWRIVFLVVVAVHFGVPNDLAFATALTVAGTELVKTKHLVRIKQHIMQYKWLDFKIHDIHRR